MAFDKNSNGFTFGFSIALVVVVGTILAVTYMALKPAYDENVRREKMQNILASLNVEVDRDAAPERFQQIVGRAGLIDAQGRPIPGDDKDPASSDAFQLDILKQYKAWKANELKAEEMLYPVYEANKEGKKLFVLPMVGTGLWGPIWGYVSVESDGRTIHGSTFDHKGETPGLGAEIATPIFEQQFPGKTMTDPNGTFTGIKVYKGGSNTTDEHGVDGISGGTITSDGVDEMLRRTLAVYDVYLKNATGNSYSQR
ncbi:MAG: NADH:ubiquinone reductase (Na(+)-transporting) subunit C [Flavobacteriales bacterium]|nr:NADH:ubiquinone reductase (Na(+)-transporting) subunit C [Flavobacteriales bacterium]